MSHKPLSLLLAAVVAASFGAIAAPVATAAPGERVRVIVELDKRASADEVVRATPSADKVRTTQVLPYVIMEVPEAAIRGLSRNPHVRAVSKDKTSAPDLASSLPVINGDDVHALGFTGAGATVAILDTGIDTNHPFFGAGGGRIVAQHCFSSDDAGAGRHTLCPDGTNDDTSADATTAQCMNGVANLCTHGTHVAGIAAGSAASDSANAPGDGVAPGAQVMAVQVFTRFDMPADCAPNAAPCVLTWDSDTVLALDWVRAQANANPGWNVVASNMSLGGGENAVACDSDPRATAVASNLAAGIATVISAGNNSFLNAVGAPGCISAAFTVGSTNDDDTVSGFSNRGTLVDVMAPGSGIDSSVPDNSYDNKSGTSMAAPMVTGALAVLRSAAPSRPIASLLADITSTGVPITYSIGGGNTTTTPRLDLLAAFGSATPNQPPTIGVDAPQVTVPEGSQATMTGTYADPDGLADVTAVTADLGSVTHAGGVWTWTHTPADGPASNTVTVTVTDSVGHTAQATFTLNVTNVAPTVVIDSISDADEGGTVTLTAHFTDPGDDTHTGAVDWGTTAGTPGTVSVTGNSVTASYTYGDNGTFPITLTVTDSDGAAGSDAGDTLVSNVAPDAAITGPPATTWNGQEIIFASAGDPVAFTADASDPGSDDLTFGWNYGDGTTDNNVSLVNPPATDPALSPSVQPRAVTDSAPHTYAMACAATVGLTVTDDDAGSDHDAALVVVLGDSTDAGTLGVWQTDFREKRSKRHTAAEKTCLLSVVRVLSGVYTETVPLDSLADAVKVLYPKQTNNAEDQFDAHLLSLWLNIADGSIALADPVDGNGDGVDDTTIGALLLSAEAERNAASPSDATLTMYKNLFEAINAAS